MPLRERLEGEVREDLGQPLRHTTVVVGDAAATERKVDRLLEDAQRFEVEVALVERAHKSAQACGSLGHPGWGGALGGRRWLDTGSELQPKKFGHEHGTW